MTAPSDATTTPAASRPFSPRGVPVCRSCSVYAEGGGLPETVTPVVYGHVSTTTQDSDSDGRNEKAYPFSEGERFLALATEQLEGRGTIVVSGAAFMSNFEVQAAVSSGSSDEDMQKNYANYKICENLVKGMGELIITPIAEVQAQTEVGLIYTIEGTVTSNASGYDKDTAFFDCIYVQDDTAGICCFPVSGEFKIGDVVRIKGYTDFYQAEMELQVQTIETIGEADPIEPAEAAAAQINDLSLLGSLVSISGTVVSCEKENDLIQTILVKDEAGDVCRVFIDGYITTAQDVQNVAAGAKITAVGLSSYDDTWKDDAYFPRIRVRDRADIVCEAVPEEEKTQSSGGKNKTANSFIDVNEGDYFFDAVEWAVAKGIIDSIENVDENLFLPDYIESRAEFVTFLWKAAGKPAAQGEMPFTDVAKDAPYYDAVLWAYTEGITAGTSETEFSPYRAVSRAMAVTLLYGYKGRPEVSGDMPFADVPETAYFYKPVLWAFTEGVTAGTSEDAFSPDGDCQRAHLVVFLYLMEK